MDRTGGTWARPVGQVLIGLVVSGPDWWHLGSTSGLVVSAVVLLDVPVVPHVCGATGVLRLWGCMYVGPQVGSIHFPLFSLRP